MPRGLPTGNAGEAGPGHVGPGGETHRGRPADSQVTEPWDLPGVHVRVERRDLPADTTGQRLFAVWHRLRDRAGGLPLWIDTEALDVPEALPGMILAVPDGGRPLPGSFRAAQVGGEVRRIWGEDFTGQIMRSTVFPEMSDALICGMRTALKQGQPVAAEYRVQIAYRISYLHIAFLPFLGQVGRQKRVLVYLNFSNITVRDAKDWRTTLSTQARIQRLLDDAPVD